MEFCDIVGKINYNFREDKHHIFQYEACLCHVLNHNYFMKLITFVSVNSPALNV